MSIFRQFRFKIVGLLIGKKRLVTDLTKKIEVVSLMQKLSPVVTDKGLIRLGPDGDGGYLVPDDLVGIEACFSPGVNNVSGFERDCANLGMKVYLADKSVDSPAEVHNLFKFTKKYIGSTVNDDYMTLDYWVKSSGVAEKSDLILQIDIEGYEYETFYNCSDDLMNRFRIIVVEFHDLDQIWNKHYFKLVSRVFDKILQTHKCVHIHPNNSYGSVKRSGLEIPCLAEFTFIRKDRITTETPARVFPHKLDFDNTDNPSIRLPKCWYSKI